MPRAKKDTAMIKEYKPRKRATKKVYPVVMYSQPRLLKGHGDYTYGDKKNMGPWERAGREIGGVLGGHFLGNSKIGSKLGSYLHYIGKIFGSGDYVTSAQNVKQNTLISDKQIPSFSHGDNSVRIRHREFLADIFSSATPNTFNIQQFPINPGLYKTFPWLSDVCGATFQQYRINGMVFEFRSMSSDALNSTNTALGSVIMATDYDSKDLPFTSKQQMENTEFGVSCKPSSCMIHGIECARNQTAVSELYVRAFDIPFGADPRLYDMGNFYIATTGMQGSNVNLGELWVSYDITLLKTIEQVPNYITPVAEYSLYIPNVSSTSALGLSGLPTNPPVKIIDQIGLKFVRDSGSDLIYLPYNLQKGTVLEFYYCILGNSTASVTPQVVSVSGGLSAVGSYLAIPTVYVGAMTTQIKGVTTVLKYDGSGTPASPPTLAFTGGIVPTNLTVATISVRVLSGSYLPDGM